MTAPMTLVHEASADQCPHCSVPMAADQRYCLNCGTRRSAPRVPIPAAETVAAPPALVPAAGAAQPSGPLAVQRLGGSWGVAALLLVALGVGVLIGSLGREDATVAARPPVVSIAAGAVGATAGTPVADTAPAADEWPDKDGFTVQLGELPKDGTDQAAADAAKSAATAKGAGAPGVLDAGAHGLTDGQLVLYSGVFDTRKQAAAALADLKAAYPDARVIKVAADSAAASGGGDGAAAGGGGGSAGGSATPASVSKKALQQTEKLNPEAFQKQSKRLPKTTALPGKAPPKDNAAPGGGGDAETIG